MKEARATPAVELQALSRALGSSFERDDVDALGALVAGQRACFDRIRAKSSASLLDPQEIATLQREGEAALALAKARLDELRSELELLRQARSSARRSRNHHEPVARFLSRRV